MLNKALLLSGSGVKKLVYDYFEFVASKVGSGVDFFGGSAPASWVVSVNGAPTSQSASALTFSSGDTVRIEYDETPAASFSARNTDYFETIDGAIPVVESTNFSSCFSVCYSLTSIPKGLFANNPNVTNFSSCFSDCIGLTSVPEGLFANNPNVTDFSRCLNFCIGLTSVPEGLFANNPNVTNFSRCFNFCSGLTVRVRISSAKVSLADNFAINTKAKGTVYVPSGSKTASTFKSTTNANVTVVEE